MSRAVTLVTGASGGIGAEIAVQMAQAGEVVVLVARSNAGLAATADRIRTAGGEVALSVPLDLSRPDSPERLAEALTGAGLVVRHLVNNAGYGLSGDAVDLSADGQLGIVDLNCRALLDLTLRFLPQIRESRGGVLNVASVAAYTAGPGLAVYYASKAFVLSFSRGLRHEMKDSGVLVCTLCPGPTATGFGARAGFTATRMSALMPGLTAADVARIGLAGYRAGRAVVIPGLVNKLGVALLHMIPQALVMPVLARAQRRRRGSAPGIP